MLVVNQSIMRGGNTVEQGTQRLLFVMPRAKVILIKLSIQLDCIVFASLRSMIGQEKWRQIFNQSDAKQKPIVCSPFPSLRVDYLQ